MKTQLRTISIPLDSSNTGKLCFLEDIHEDVKAVARKFLKFKMKQIQDNKEHNFSEEQKQKYKEYREQYPDLNSGILQDTMKWIEDRVKAHIQNCKKHHRLTKWPEINYFPINIRNQTSTMREDDRHHDMWYRFCRTNFPLHICKFHQKVLDKTVKFGDSQIIKKDGEWYLQSVCKIEIEDGEQIDENKALGVDLGIAQPVVCSDGKRIGNGSRITHKKKEFGKKRSKQQPNKHKITSKQRRWMIDQNHKMSRALVDYALSQGTGVLHLEDLQGQHLSNKKWRSYKWAFAELLEFIRYKAKAVGIKVVDVDPAYTSQTCSRCGHKSRENRRTRSLFVCERCGARFDADVNAAKNICSLSVANGPPVNQAKRVRLKLKAHEL